MTRPLAVNLSLHVGSVGQVVAQLLPNGGIAVDLLGEADRPFPCVTLVGTVTEIRQLVAALAQTVADATAAGRGVAELTGNTIVFRGPSWDADPLASGITTHGHPGHALEVIDNPEMCGCCGVELAEDNTASDAELCRACFSSCAPTTERSVG